MCFTVAVNIVREEMEKRFGARFTDPSWFKAGYLFSAFRLPKLPVIDSEDPNSISPASWGLIPRWIKNKTEADKIRYKTFNARKETIFEKPSFRHAAHHRHCLVPVTGFYEWHEAPFGKIPYFLRLKNRPVFSLAGLYEEWTDHETGEVIPTFTVITLPANPLLEKIHNTRKRMPAVLAPEMENEWLTDAYSEQNAGKILNASAGEEFDFYPVSKKIVAKDADPYDDSAIQPYDYGYNLFQQDLFHENSEEN